MTEWIAAAAVFGAVLAAGSAVVLEFRSVRAVMPVSAREPMAPDAPTSLHPSAISVPFVLLSDGTRVDVGENLQEVTARLGNDAGPELPSVERTPTGERTTRFYFHAGKRFALLFERGERDPQPVVTAIYLQ